MSTILYSTESSKMHCTTVIEYLAHMLFLSLHGSRLGSARTFVVNWNHLRLHMYF